MEPGPRTAGVRTTATAPGGVATVTAATVAVAPRPAAAGAAPPVAR